MVVDALVIDGSYLEPSDPFLVLELAGCITDNVFNENRVVVGLHGDLVDWDASGVMVALKIGQFFHSEYSAHKLVVSHTRTLRIRTVWPMGYLA